MRSGRVEVGLTCRHKDKPRVVVKAVLAAPGTERRTWTFDE